MQHEAVCAPVEHKQHHFDSLHHPLLAGHHNPQQQGAEHCHGGECHEQRVGGAESGGRDHKHHEHQCHAYVRREREEGLSQRVDAEK